MTQTVRWAKAAEESECDPDVRPACSPRSAVGTAVSERTYFVTITLCIGLTLHSPVTPISRLIVNACCKHERFRERDVHGAIETKLIGIHLICFQPEGGSLG